MKKVLASIMIVCYLALSCGVVINLHYCMGRLDSVKLFSVKDEMCGKCGMKNSKSHGCCGNEIKIIKLQDDQNNAHVSNSIKGLDISVNTPSEFIASLYSNAGLSFHYNNYPPPLLTKQNAYLQNCTFRI